MTLGEIEAYGYVFGTHPMKGIYFKEPYELVLVLKDGSRWKVDPN